MGRMNFLARLAAVLLLQPACLHEDVESPRGSSFLRADSSAAAAVGDRKGTPAGKLGDGAATAVGDRAACNKELRSV